jgi:hypothetical protein
MKLPRREFLQLAAGAAALSGIAHAASAQNYPARPLRPILGYPAGGSTDLVARIMGAWPRACRWRRSRRLHLSRYMPRRSGCRGCGRLPSGTARTARLRTVTKRLAGPIYKAMPSAWDSIRCYSRGHSVRSGFLTSAAKRGASIFKMMDQSRYRSVASGIAPGHKPVATLPVSGRCS